MRLTRPLFFLVLGVGISCGLVSVIFSKASQIETPVGCQPKTTAGQFDPSQTVAFWNNQALTPPSYLASVLTEEDRRVLGVNTDDKWIEVDLTRQMLIAHQGDSVFLQSPISSGLTNPTPTGSFRIWYKITSTLMEGGSKTNNTYYYLPNVPFDMFFSGDYGIHGTYWHHNFGHPMSHGCVNTPTPVSEKLFYWTDPQLPPGQDSVKADPDHPGTLIVIHR